ncbi:MAG: DEAD/DEAH box helicase family protein, partial [Planctomycetaceae bacterium]|nr:DEAD/DEAH box helicase family protein [Planctomycetaceae bacterium]
MALTRDRFSEFFAAVYGKNYAPFPWQQRLIERVANEQIPWPECLALPTSAGKTACIDIAVFALACQAERPPKERTAPRRIFLVVDRRVIVDQAYRHAEILCEKLDAAKNGILHATAEALRGISSSKVPLTCHELRGGIYRDDAWALTPAQACVIASTVDQVGSRLLFRSYGCSDHMAPIYAGLTGNDALILLDEAHCAQPFLQTIKAVRLFRGEKWAEQPIKAAFHVVSLSATPPPELKDVLHAEKETDFTDPVLGPRLTASKPVQLSVAQKARGKKLHRELAGAM